MTTANTRKINSTKPNPTFDHEVKVALMNSWVVADEMHDNFIAVEHIFLGMLQINNAKFLKNIQAEWNAIRDELYAATQKKYPPQENYDPGEPHLTPSAANILVLAVMGCILSERTIVTTQDLFLAILTNNNLARNILSRRGINYDMVYATYINNGTQSPERVIYRNRLSIRDKLFYKIRFFYRRYINQ